MKKELILKEWQADIIKDKSKIIMVNTSRGGSKTFLLANKVLYEKPKTVLYINSNLGHLKILKDHFEEIFYLDENILESIKYYNFSKNKLFIEFNTGKTITVYDKKEIFEEDEKIDMVLFDDGLPQLDIEAKKYVSAFTIKYPIMNFFNCRKDISYHVVGIKKLIESGYLTKEQIKDAKKDIGDLMFDKEFDLCNEYNEMFKEEKTVRGLRRNANLYEESTGDFKANNIYLTQKERNVIRCDIESTLHKFENEVDNTLRNNELQLAKINHNVVDACRDILDKLQFADYECLENSKYYLTIDLDRQGENKVILFRQYEDKLKIDKFIDFYERDFTKIAKKLINEIKPYKNGKIIIPSIVFGQNLIDFIKAEGFEDIIELDLKDINRCNIYNLELFNDKNKIYNLSDVNIGGKEYHIEFIRLKKQLDNLTIKTNNKGSNSRFDMKDKDIDKYWIVCVFYTLYKLGYKL